MTLIDKLTGLPVSEKMKTVIERLNKGENVILKEIQELQEVKEAASCLSHAVPTIQLQNREGIRQRVFNEVQKMGSAVIDEKGAVMYNGIIKKESRIDIVIGLPASGKSSTLVNPISQQYKSRIIDSDEAKKLLPEYNNGWGAGVVHQESKMIADNQIIMAAKKQENIVYPIVGSHVELIKKFVESMITNGYKIYIHYNEVDKNKSLARMLMRFLEEGRFIPPNILYEYEDKVFRTYETLKGGKIDGYSKWNNDVPNGEQPNCIENFNGVCTRMAGNREKSRRTNTRTIAKSEGEPRGIPKTYVGESPLTQNHDKENLTAGFSFFASKDDYSLFAASHAAELSKRQKNARHTTMVINAYGGPGAGKSTASLCIAEELKKQGYLAEYIPEYSKELVWEENWELLDGTAAHQFEILTEQMKRMDRLMGKVDFIVTDAPILLNRIYNRELTPGYEKMLLRLYSQYENFNFVVQRNPKEFENTGRIHDLKESRQKDREISNMLDKYQLYYGTYNHASVNKIIPNAVKTHGRISSVQSASKGKDNGRTSVLAKLNQNKEHIKEGEKLHQTVKDERTK